VTFGGMDSGAVKTYLTKFAVISHSTVQIQEIFNGTYRMGLIGREEINWRDEKRTYYAPSYSLGTKPLFHTAD